MRIVIYTGLLSFVTAYGLTLVVSPLARRLGAVDRPDQFRKVHEHEIPRLGGVAVFAAFLTGLVFLLCLPSVSLWNQIGRIGGLSGAVFVIVLMGVVDDIRELRARWKLLWQVVAAGLACWSGFVVREISLPLLGNLDLGYISVPATVLWFVACTNAINLIDGLDGLAAGVSLAACVAIVLICGAFGHGTTLLLGVCLAGAILGFLVHNFHPATVFLGDSGSQMLGFLLAAFWLCCVSVEGTGWVALVPLMAMGIPILDTGVAVLRRWSHRLPLMAPDRQHVHHVLLAHGLSHRGAVMVLYVASSLLCSTAVLCMVDGRDEVMASAVLVLGCIGFAFVRSMGMLAGKELVQRACQDWVQHKDLNAAKVELAKAVHRMKQARDVQEAWQLSETVFEHLHLDMAVLALSMKSPGVDGGVWSWHADGISPEASVTDSFWYEKLPLGSNGSSVGVLEVGIVLNEKHTVIPEVTELLGGLQRSLAENLLRLDRCSASREGTGAGRDEHLREGRNVAGRLHDQFVCLHPGKS